MENNPYTIDGSGKILGRLASEVAIILMGKNKPDFLPYKLSTNKVIVFNTAKIVITGNKEKDKRYYRHSGYLGGIKFSTFREISQKNPSIPFRKAVYRMLPKNKLRDRMIKNLKLYAADYKEQK